MKRIERSETLQTFQKATHGGKAILGLLHTTPDLIVTPRGATTSDV
jgi:hypothetical protein